MAKVKSSPFKQRLAKMKKHWLAAREDSGSGFDNLPEGRFVAKITKAELNESQNGRLQIHWAYEVLQGDEKGQTQHSYDGLETPDNLVWVARKLARLGIEDVEEMEIEDIESILEEIEGGELVVRIRVKENGDFTNVYIDKLLDADEIEDDDSTPTPKKKKKAKPADDDDEESEDDDDEESEDDESENEDDETEITYEDVMEMSKTELAALIEDNDLKVKLNMPIPTQRKKVAEALELEPSEDESEDDESDDDESGDDEQEPTKGCKVICIHNGKTVEAKVLAIKGKMLTCKTKKGEKFEIAKSKVEVDDTPF